MLIELPRIVLGTSTLGNLYQAIEQEAKTSLLQTFISLTGKPVFIDTAGKYGAGLALEALGAGLKTLAVAPDDVVISNKLGWYRVPLRTPEPMFEKDIWKNIHHDAVQKMGYEGILECYEQGNELLNGYKARLVSVHDPDEYLAAAVDKRDESGRYNDILEAYRALFALKQSGKVVAVGVGAKAWRVIQRLSADVAFDWIMIANSMTLHDHPAGLMNFMSDMQSRGVSIINSAIFNGGFITGGKFYNYQEVKAGTAWGDSLLLWREKFYVLCREFNLKPAEVAIQFGLRAPGVNSIAISSSSTVKLAETIKLVHSDIPIDFWKAMQASGLVDSKISFDNF